jgi:chromosome segregation ATPase
MNAIGCNQIEPDFAVTIPHPPKKARNLNDYKGTTLGELIDLLEHSWEQRDRMGKQRDEAEKKAERVVNELHNVLGQRDKAEKKCEAQAKRIRELEDGLAPATDRILAHQKEIAEQLLKRMELHEQVNRLKEELATHKKDIAYARETVEIANNTIIGQQGEINWLRDINIAQAAELSKLREQLKDAEQATTLHYQSRPTLATYDVRLDTRSGCMQVTSRSEAPTGRTYVLEIPIERWFKLGRASVE